MVFAEKDKYSRYVDEWHGLKKLRSWASKTVVVGAVVAGGLGTFSNNSTIKRIEVPHLSKQEVTTMLRKDTKVNPTEVVMLSYALRDASPYSYSTNMRYMNTDFVKRVLKESEWASEQLNIPKQFILSQWFMEDGMLQPSGFNYVSKNNLAGIQTPDGNPVRFDNLHEFAEAYVAILQKDGVYDTNSFVDIVNRLCDGNYAGGEGPESYGSKVLNTMRLLREVGSEYNQYYKKSYMEFNDYAELEK